MYFHATIRSPIAWAKLHLWEDLMAKLVIQWSFWLGVVFAVLAPIARAFNALGISFLVYQTKGGSIGYRTYLDGAIFLFVISIATTNYVGLGSRERQS
jgi:hypothetical protein